MSECSIALLQQLIQQHSIKSVVEHNISCFIFLRSVERLSVIEIAELLKVNISSLRKWFSYFSIVQQNDHPEFTKQVTDYYNKHYNKSKCQLKFKIGFRELERILNLSKNEICLNIDFLRNNFVKRKTLNQIAKDLNIHVSTLRSKLKNLNFSYTLEFLFLTDITNWYLNDNLTIKEIAEKLNVSYQLILRIVKENSIVKPNQQRKQSIIRKNINCYGVPSWNQTTQGKVKLSQRKKHKDLPIINEYSIKPLIDDGLSVKQIAFLLKTNQNKISNICRSRNLKVLTKNEYLTMLKSKSFKEYIGKSPKRDSVYKLITQNDWINQGGLDGTYQFVCVKHGIFTQTGKNHFIHDSRCPKCSNNGTASRGELQVLEYVKTLGRHVESNTRSVIHPKEIDIYIPECKLAIEFNGMFWHSSPTESEYNKNRHLFKTKLCEQQGIKLFHIFEDEWNDYQKREIWKSYIRQACLPVYNINKTQSYIQQVLMSETIEFFKNNSLDVINITPNSKAVGLYENFTLLTCVVITDDVLYYCNNINFNVIDGIHIVISSLQNIGSTKIFINKRYDLRPRINNLNYITEHPPLRYYNYSDRFLYDSGLDEYLISMNKQK